MSEGLPNEARCLTCGYLLRELPGATCPECGRAFDPGDPKTFDAAPIHRKRRRWIRRGVVVAGAIGLGLMLTPRRLLRSEIVFICHDCNAKVEFSRIEPQSPEWLGFRYPGIAWKSGSVPSESEATNASEHDHEFRRGTMATDLWSGGSCSVGIDAAEGGVAINETVPTLDSAKHMLKQAAAPGNTGLRTSRVHRDGTPVSIRVTESSRPYEGGTP